MRTLAPAARLVVGDVMHARLRPKAHRFRYRVFALDIDLDRLAEAGCASRVFSVGRANLLSFHEKDHGPCGPLPLADRARARFAEAGIEAARVRLLAYPRLLGYAFNPIALYYGYDADGRLRGVLAEVRNTFGERHIYLLPIEPGARPEVDKRLHVSPFLGMAARYRFGLTPPGDEVRVSIVEHDARGPILTAVFHGRAAPLTTRRILAAVARTPLMTAKVVVAIHLQALRLWAKGIAVVPHPGRAKRGTLPGSAP